jgi:hypothetical protein
MRVFLALAIFAVSSSAVASEKPAKPYRLGLLCMKSGDHSSGLTKICYYDCAGSEAATTVKLYDQCPRWTPRWRLNHNSQFGPSGFSH